MDRLLVFQPAGWADNYTGTWLSPLLLLVTVASVPTPARVDPDLPYAAAVGSLRVSVRPSGGLTSEDGSSPPSNASTVVTSGSWGDVVCDGGLHVYSHNAVVVAFLPPAGAPYTPINYTLTVSTSPTFPSGPATRSVSVLASDSASGSDIVLPTEAPESSLRYVVSSLTPGEPVYVRVAAAVPPLPVEVTQVLPREVAPVAWPIGSSGGCSCAVVVTGLDCGDAPGIGQSMTPSRPVIGAVSCGFMRTCGSASKRYTKLYLCVSLSHTQRNAGSVTALAGTLATSGSSVVEITGLHLGVNASAVFLSYVGGSTGYTARTYTTAPGTCTIVTAGTRLRCATVPGAGANFSFTVHVDGAPSDASVDTLSYTPPSIADVTVPGMALVPLAGIVTVLVRGSNFGPISGTNLRVWAVPSADQSKVFLAHNCEVVEAHVTIRCSLGSRLGAKLNFRVRVEGQDNTLPQISLAPPKVTRVSLVGAAFARTPGGTLLLVEGHNFGDSAADVRVVVETPGGASDAANCIFVSSDSQLQCALPAGTGAVSRVSVTVLDQTGALDVSHIAYAPPTLASVSPTVWPTDVTTMTVTLAGSGFGSQAQSGLVSVTARAVDYACTDPPGGVTLVASGVSVLTDSELSFSFRTPAPHVALRWALSVVVAGQGLAAGDAASAAAATVATRAPSVPSIAFAEPGNGTHMALLLTGSNYGSVVSPCASDVAVTVAGAPCESLAIVQVGACGWSVAASVSPIVMLLLRMGLGAEDTLTHTAAYHNTPALPGAVRVAQRLVRIRIQTHKHTLRVLCGDSAHPGVHQSDRLLGGR